MVSWFMHIFQANKNLQMMIRTQPYHPSPASNKQNCSFFLKYPIIRWFGVPGCVKTLSAIWSIKMQQLNSIPGGWGCSTSP